MKEIKGSIDSLESFSTIDGPGIRCVVFLNGCNKRCKFCHNPEMWTIKDNNITPLELKDKIIRFKPYFKNKGGVTFSGGEALMQPEFLIETMKLLKKENINIALETAGFISPYNEEILKYVDLVLLDIKHTNEYDYKELTKISIKDQEEFIKLLNKLNKKIWIRQVITKGITDSINYIDSLSKYLEKINNIEKIEFLPYHNMALSKYEKLKIDYILKDTKDMDKDKCEELYKYLINIIKKKSNHTEK